MTTQQYLLNGEPVDLDEFIAENEDIDAAQILRLNVGESIMYGGGAAPLFELSRLA